MKKTANTIKNDPDKQLQVTISTETWESMLPLLLQFLKSKSPEARLSSRSELLRMAKIADMYVELAKKKQ